MKGAHGTHADYTGGCRCPDCRRAAAEYRRDLRHRSRGGGSDRAPR